MQSATWHSSLDRRRFQHPCRKVAEKLQMPKRREISADIRRIVKKAPDEGFGNRFDKWVFPSLAPIVRGEEATGHHPDLEDGWIAQKFTDAAAKSVEGGCWVKV